MNVIRIEAAFTMDWDAMILASGLQHLRSLMNPSGASFQNGLEILTAPLVGPRCTQVQGAADVRFGHYCAAPVRHAVLVEYLELGA